MSLRRYVREVDESTRSLGGWHEMLDHTRGTLCGVLLAPWPLDRSSEQGPLKFHQVTGTNFPGVPCGDCQYIARWRDENAIFHTYDTAEAPS